MRKLKLALAFAAWLMISPALSVSNLHYHVVPPTNRSSLAITSSNLASWTNVAYSDPSITGFSGHTILFQPNTGAASHVGIVLVIDNLGSCSARLTSIYYDASGNAIWNYTWPVISVGTSYHPNRVEYDVTSNFNSLIAGSPYIQQVTMDLKGSCKLYMARLEVAF